LRLGISSLLFVNRTIEDAIRMSAELGADWVEIIFDIPHFPPGWDPRELVGIRSLLSSYRLGVSVHASFWDINPISHHRELRDLSLRQVEMSIDTCAELGGDITVVHFGRCSIPEVEWLRRTAEGKYSEFVDSCALYARERGVRIALENPGRDPRSYPGTFEDLRRVAEGKEGVGVTFDIGHANLFFRRKGRGSTGRRIADCIREMRDLIIHFHVHDNRGTNDDHLPPGKGGIDFVPVLRSIEEIGYSGAVILELWEPENPLSAGRQAMEWARQHLLRKTGQ